MPTSSTPSTWFVLTDRVLIWWFIVSSGLLAALPGRASHVVGGQLELRALTDRPGHFQVGVLYYFDENQTYSPPARAPLALFRKRDHQYITYVDVFNQTIDERPRLPFINQPCASQRELAISEVLYTGEMQLDPAQFSDPQGYYITYQTCCRNGGISSIERPLEAGYVFYLEFPPLQWEGKPLLNSSPVFDPIDGEFVCLGKPFTMAFAARDADGDELRYQLVTPLAGFQGADGGQQVRSGPYPEVRWRGGYSAQGAIPGNPALQIDARTGQLSVTASQVGLFVFTVLVEEYRQGRRLGLVRRDYQLLVVDCPANQPPNPVVSIDGQVDTDKLLCQGQWVTLSAPATTDWVYQWRKDGQLVSGATSATLRTDQPGVYQLVATLPTKCANAGRSASVHLRQAQSRFPLSASGPPALCQPGSRLQLTGPELPQQTYQWYASGESLPDQRSPSLWVDTPGRYWLVLTDHQTGCQQRSDTVVVRGAALQVPLITVRPGGLHLCAGDYLWLSAAGQPEGHQQWLRDGQPVGRPDIPTLTVRQGGVYSLRVTDALGCSAVSAGQSITLLQPLVVQLDSIPPQCAGATEPLLSLRGIPSGGVFTGPGVQGDSFSAAGLPPGRHRLTYRLQLSSLACQQGQVTRWVEVLRPPAVALGGPLTSWRGTGVVLPGPVVGGYQYGWAPAASLDNATLARPLAQPDTPTEYTLTVTDQQGCQGRGSVWVQLRERLWIPSAFSPNGDGVNDVWVIGGLEALPQAAITVYDRWGEVVYSGVGTDPPFDGRFKGALLPPGGYPYRIQGPQGMEYRGTLFIL